MNRHNNAIVPGFDFEKCLHLKIKLKRIYKIPGCLCLYLKGHLDDDNMLCLKHRVTRAIELGFIQLVFDLGGYYDVSEAGIALFTGIFRIVASRGGNVVLTRMNVVSYDIYKAIGFANFFPIAKNLSEAIIFYSRSNN